MKRFAYCLLIILYSSCYQKGVEVSKDSVKMHLPDELPLKDINTHLWIGSHIDTIHNNYKYLNIVKSEFNYCQALWYARWKGWLGKEQYDFSGINRNINWMTKNKVSSHVHMLVGPDTYMPDWLIKADWTPKELDDLLRNMIYNIMDANDNKDKVDIWNVINEIFADDGTYRTDMVWNKMGWENDESMLTGVDKINEKHPVFIRKAFMYCREKTGKKLELRDFNIENNDPLQETHKKHKGMYQLLKHMLNTNIPVDAVGIQGHLLVGKISWLLDKNGLKETVQKFKALGIEVYITELDARIGRQIWTDGLAQKQSNDYYNYIKQAIQGGATRINFWGIQDGLDKGWITKEHPLLWDENLDRKLAYWRVKQALKDTK